jgi:DNA-binding NarL/FixJ family response regulator
MSAQTEESLIRLLVLIDQRLFRASLGRLLASQPDFEVVGECGASSEALEILKSSPVDVVLLEFVYGTEHGVDLISTARSAGYQGRFLILTGSADARNSAMAFNLAHRVFSWNLRSRSG